MKPYLGVTGFKNPELIRTALEICAFHEEDNCNLMAGVLVSRKTLETGALPRQSPERYPELDAIKDIFFEHPFALNLIHYCCDHIELRVEDMAKVIFYIGGANCHGIQLNTVWPSKDVLIEFREKYDSKIPKVVVMQVGKDALTQINNNPAQLCKELKHYSGLVDYVLIDESMGTGKAINAHMVSEYLAEAYGQGLNETFRFVIAGGLSGNNIIDIRDILKEFPDTSIDAEGKLHDPVSHELEGSILRHYITMARIHMQPQTSIAR